MRVSLDLSDLQKLKQELRDKREPLKQVAEVVSEDVRQRFDLLAPDAPSTLRSKRRRGLPPDPLVSSGALLEAATALSPSVPGTEYSIGPDGLTLGVDVPGAEEAQYGTAHEQVRQFFPDEDAVELLLETKNPFDSWVDELVRGIE